ncbi:hypothetical protein [Kitasatospora sp. CB02891]|uniref:hypothetical protein n=1 Tax=Kitasatospora sp. CB02891 TaxID=2020329 RepID=UPI000C28000B|nr:hypothetical protein [Kitasatospora sp. CB02891]PJN29295.1 hypothetical protein CG736_01685 [Kitasatospora sp. CB02891]
MAPPSIEAARVWQRRLRDVAPGLTERELDAVAAARFGFRFAADHRAFPAAGLPTGPSWPDWRYGAPTTPTCRSSGPAGNSSAGGCA